MEQRNAAMSTIGSSPRVRGKHSTLTNLRLSERIIPASAGQTWRPTASNPSRPDHPRECGANAGSGSRRARHHGSSPRVRGKQLGVRRERSPARIIPASAGQTKHRRRTFGGQADHPRECGANALSTYSIAAVTGSSPRVRGKRPTRRSDRRHRRIIPASAGQTTVVFARWLPASDHPRECGANGTFGGQVGDWYGSSPRVRGKRRGIRA